MTEAQKLAKAVADLPGSRAFDDAQLLASVHGGLMDQRITDTYNRAIEDAKGLASVHGGLMDQRIADTYNRAVEDAKGLASLHGGLMDRSVTGAYSRAIEDAKGLASAGSHAITEAQRLSGAFTSFADSPAMKDMQRLGGLITGFADSPVMKDMQRLAGAFTGFADSPVVRDMQRLAGAFTSFADSPIMRDVQRLSEAAAGFANSPAVREAHNFVGAFSAASDLPTFAALSGLGKAFDHYRRNPNLSVVEAFAGTSAGQTLQELLDNQIAKSATGIFAVGAEGVRNKQSGALSKADDAPIDPNLAVYEAIFDAVNSIHDTLKSGKAGPLESYFVGYLYPLILCVFFYILSGIDLDNQKQEVISHIDESKQQIVENINDKLFVLKESFEQLSHRIEKSPDVYIAVRRVRLNWQRKYSGGHYLLLEPGQEVEVLRRSGKWLEVRAILPDQTEITGWVLKKYMRAAR